jgi:hypothetical protein
MTDRLLEIEKRNARQMMYLGFAGVAAGPLAYFFVPFGLVIGLACVVLGILGIAQGIRLRARVPKE